MDNNNKHVRMKKGNKSFVEVRQTVSRRTLAVSQAESGKSAAYNKSKSIQHKSVGRRELFDKHFSKVLLSSNKYRDKVLQNMFGHPLMEEYINAPPYTNPV